MFLFLFFWVNCPFKYATQVVRGMRLFLFKHPPSLGALEQHVKALHHLSDPLVMRNPTTTTKKKNI